VKTTIDKKMLLEKFFNEIILPVNGQYPRPWMTESIEPWESKIFIVGKNQAKTFSQNEIGSREAYISSLFNRGDESCRELYNRLSRNKPSRTRGHIDKFVDKLKKQNLSDIIETNVVCYSTPMSVDLRQAIHSGGIRKGSEIFLGLLEIIEPKVIVVHGVGAAKELARLINIEIPNPPKDQEREILITKFQKSCIITIPSLASPEYEKWANWSDVFLDDVSNTVSKIIFKSSAYN
jgi:hypothetical protein